MESIAFLSSPVDEHSDGEVWLLIIVQENANW